MHRPIDTRKKAKLRCLRCHLAAVVVQLRCSALARCIRTLHAACSCCLYEACDSAVRGGLCEHFVSTRCKRPHFDAAGVPRNVHHACVAGLCCLCERQDRMRQGKESKNLLRSTEKLRKTPCNACLGAATQHTPALASFAPSAVARSLAPPCIASAVVRRRGPAPSRGAPLARRVQTAVVLLRAAQRLPPRC